MFNKPDKKEKPVSSDNEGDFKNRGGKWPKKVAEVAKKKRDLARKMGSKNMTSGFSGKKYNI